jgi:hypothetical protein
MGKCRSLLRRTHPLGQSFKCVVIKTARRNPVTSRLVNIGIALALMLGCGGSTFAAALCPHAECFTAAGPTVAPASDGAGEGTRDSHHAHSTGAVEGHHHDAPAEAQPEGAPRPLSSLLGSHNNSCDHCVGRRQSTPASELKRQSNAPKRDDRVAALPLSRPHDLPVTDFVQEITPHQGAPPGRASRHILNSVFRI